MKIAVIDHIGNHGGGSRVVRSLLPALKRQAPNIEIQYFGNPASIRRENLEEEFSSYDIGVTELASLRLANSTIFSTSYALRAIEIIQSRFLQSFSWLPEIISGNVVREIERKVTGYDLIFYPWPFMMAFPGVKCPAIGIFHDFNFKYYFGGSFVFSAKQRAQLERDIPAWLAGTTPVVSTHFMASELATFYPEAATRTRVVHLPALGGNEPVADGVAKKTVEQLGIHSPYLLCPTHMCSHKNVGPVIAALALLRSKGRHLTFVLTGAGTEAIRGQACDIGLRLDSRNPDVVGLGYVSNHQMDSLIQCASVVINPSLYEAGNGPGLDAFGCGAPVAMSDIPAFREHLSTLGVRAQLFDPRSPTDIATKIAIILDNPIETRANAQHSLDAMKNITWDKTANSYLEIFRETISPHK